MVFVAVVTAHSAAAEHATIGCLQIYGECVYFLSRDKDGGHAIRSATTTKNPCCWRASRLYLVLNRSYCRLKFYIAEIGNFALFSSCDLDFDLDPIIFMYELDPYSL